jgi:hypothetical protein
MRCVGYLTVIPQIRIQFEILKKEKKKLQIPALVLCEYNVKNIILKTISLPTYSWTFTTFENERENKTRLQMCP